MLIVFSFQYSQAVLTLRTSINCVYYSLRHVKINNIRYYFFFQYLEIIDTIIKIIHFFFFIFIVAISRYYFRFCTRSVFMPARRRWPQWKLYVYNVELTFSSYKKYIIDQTENSHKHNTLDFIAF